jgi:hypothetical protein
MTVTSRPDDTAKADNAQASVEEMDDALARLRALVEEGDVEAARALLPPLLERWPEAPRIRYWARVLEPASATVLHGEPARSFAEEREWLRRHRAEHPGCWIAVYGDRLIAADPDLERVYQAVRDALGDQGAVIYFQGKDPA